MRKLDLASQAPSSPTLLCNQSSPKLLWSSPHLPPPQCCGAAITSRPYSLPGCLSSIVILNKSTLWDCGDYSKFIYLFLSFSSPNHTPNLAPQGLPTPFFLRFSVLSFLSCLCPAFRSHRKLIFFGIWKHSDIGLCNLYDVGGYPKFNKAWSVEENKIRVTKLTHTLFGYQKLRINIPSGLTQQVIEISNFSLTQFAFIRIVKAL